MPSFPAGLRQAFEDGIRKLDAEFLEPQVEAILRSAVDTWSRHFTDEYRFLLTSDGSARQALPDGFRAVARDAGDARRLVKKVESKIDQDPEQVLQPDDWKLVPDVRRPRAIQFKAGSPASGDIVGLLCHCPFLYQLETPAAPTVTGAAGGSSHTYRIVAVDDFGNTTPAGAARVFASNGTARTITVAVQRGAASYQVWRTGGGPDQGMIGELDSDACVPEAATVSLEDDDLAADPTGAPPTANTTESTIPKTEWRFVGSVVAVIRACLQVRALNRNNIPPGFKSSLKNWQALFDNAGALMKDLNAELAAYLTGGVAGESSTGAGSAAQKGVLSVGFVGDWLEPISGTYEGPI